MNDSAMNDSLQAPGDPGRAGPAGVSLPPVHRDWKPSVTVAAVVERDGRYLLVEEHTHDGVRLNQPAGHLDPGETLAQAFAMVEVLGQSQISRDAFQSAADRSLTLVSEAQLQIGTEQARIGSGEARLKNAVEALQSREGRLASALQALEGVDPYEAATRLNLLMTQLETSYALTGRINRMSLLSYI